MGFVKQWSASLSHEQAEFSGRVTLSCSVNNNQSYRLSVLLQYNLLIHCEQFRYSNLITILDINYLLSLMLSKTTHKISNHSKAWFVSGCEMDHFLVTMVPGKQRSEKSNLSWALHLCDVYCCRVPERKNARKKSCRPNVYLAIQSPFHGQSSNLSNRQHPVTMPKQSV